MIEIDIDEHAPALRPLFEAGVREERPRLFAVLEGNHRGRALVDAAPHPRWAVLRERLFGTTYLGGEPDGASLRAALAQLRRDGRVLFDRRDPRVSDLVAEAAGEDPRIAFTGRIADDERLQRLARAVPEGVRVEPIDRQTLARCLWRLLSLALFDDEDGYLDCTLGFCVVRGDELLSEAHAFFWGGGEVEIGTITHEAHRGAGYATAACAALVLACQELGYRTTWGCDLDNPASAAVARKLGYPEEHRYDLLRFEALWTVPIAKRAPCP